MCWLVAEQRTEHGVERPCGLSRIIDNHVESNCFYVILKKKNPNPHCIMFKIKVYQNHLKLEQRQR